MVQVNGQSINQSTADLYLNRDTGPTQESSGASSASGFVTNQSSARLNATKADFFLLPIFFLPGCAPGPSAEMQKYYDLDSKYEHIDGSVEYKVKKDHDLSIKVKTSSGEIVEWTVHLQVGDTVGFSKESGDVFVSGISGLRQMTAPVPKIEITGLGRASMQANRLKLGEFDGKSYSEVLLYNYDDDDFYRWSDYWVYDLVNDKKVRVDVSEGRGADVFSPIGL